LAPSAFRSIASCRELSAGICASRTSFRRSASSLAARRTVRRLSADSRYAQSRASRSRSPVAMATSQVGADKPCCVHGRDRLGLLSVVRRG
jgi:hypothetical protein